ncbi:MAG: hypothetical protein IRZ32_05765 [Solirubrobacteraceae bacterium]|nr:hypothetical protein [Solirubrobacteraceae bacterium]
MNETTSRVPPRLRAAVAGLVLAAVALAAIAAGPAAAPAAVPDPLAKGPYQVRKIEYEAGTLLLNLPTAGQTTSVPMRGSIHYPADAGPARIILFIHGRHAVCIGTPPSGSYVCGDETADDGTPISTDIRSYGGYDYLAENLASHGYAVMSVEANTTGFDNGYPDAGANTRSQIIYASLQLLYRWNNGAGPVVPGDPGRTVGTKLVGRLDFTDGIGLMGHSRGGDAVTDFIAYNRNLPSGSRRFALDAVLSLAPTYYTANKVPYGTNYATLLPACDGDVSNLQGARFFENAKYHPGNATTAKIQWYVQGADHNFFNTVWTDDDFADTYTSGGRTYLDPACSRAATATTKRLSAADQRRVGIALMGGFLRRYVGDELEFDPLMTGAETLPATLPLSTGPGVGQTVKTSYVGPQASRLDVLRPEPTQDPPTDPPAPADPDALTVDAQGGAITTSGLSTFEVCSPSGPSTRGSATLPTAYPFCPALSPVPPGVSNGANRSIGTQYTIGWDGPATLTAALGPDDGDAKDVSGFGVLTLRAATIRWDPRNPQGDGHTPTAATQDFDVTLVDADGRRATTSAARWTTSLQPSIGIRYQHVVLNGVRIPLSAFAADVDLTRITAVELGFGTRTPTGAIQLADVAFQERAPSGGHGAAVPVQPVTGPPDGPPSPLPGPIIGAPEEVATTAASETAAPAGEGCVDATRPTSRMTRMRVSRRAVRVGGIALDAGCPGASGPAAGGVARTLVQVVRAVPGGGCRYVTVTGRLTGRRSCDEPVGMYARGTRSWSLRIDGARIPPGVYAVRVVTYDRSGNATRLKTRRVRVR